MSEKHLAVAVAVGVLLWLVLSMSGLDVQWFGIAIDGGLMKLRR